MNNTVDILIVGAGPAGLAAAYAASQQTDSVLVIDDNPHTGGQIWRGGPDKAPSVNAKIWFKRIQDSKLNILTNATVIDAPKINTLSINHNEVIKTITYKKLIIATGARELFLPFPGWTLPNVFGAGGLQAIVKSGLPVTNKRILVSGSGPLLLAVAAYLKQHNAKVIAVAEQAPITKLAKFTGGLLVQPAKLAQAIKLKLQTRGIKYKTSSWITSVRKENDCLVATMSVAGKKKEIECDYIANAYGLVPNLEIPQMLGCTHQPAGVFVNKNQETSVENIYAVGETTGIGGIDLALLQGQIAGYDATINTQKKVALRGAIRKAERFAIALNSTFALRDDIKQLASGDTIVCRCEDVQLSRILPCNTWREAKLQTRCGMGPCQGRICGPALNTIKGFKVSSVRPPLFPVTINQVVSEHSE